MPLTSRSIAELFAIVVRQFSPFREADIGFKDAVIYFSIIDQLRTDAAHGGAFVSADRIFLDAKMRRVGSPLVYSSIIFFNVCGEVGFSK